MTRTLSATSESWPIAGGFTISRGTKTTAEVVVAKVTEGGHTGRGECVPYARYDETVEGVIADIEKFAGAVASGLTREALQTAMPAGAARNALDCALLDLEAKTSGKSAADILGISPPAEAVTAYTISLGTPDKMAADARAAAHRPLIKVKLGGAGDVERIRAVRANALGARLIVDANEAWTDDLFAPNMEACKAAGVELVEQPLPAGNDAMLASLAHAAPVCADESVHISDGLADLADRYDAVNIKLDKAGGITEALKMAKLAQDLGLTVMVGSMLATSLAVAPAYLLSGYAAFLDIDGPLLLAKDREPGLAFDGSTVRMPDPALWG
ncbi:L-alanine-DL-glutamate epimerase-like enolase superfamily enzyme [Rhodobium orientis]|uniref:Dipeptide epimerase n=1 Tax=Rhodobium orientis TaxID=34017 RepID=A0A327JHX6_9HYPH|nr:N-acetyl-D-Glu racemase DgcA [Rhodobium orientis]MBB4303106.1 L-alanine-DL-glutamate epimerase-like enolase superfamily enzyme [Rhodobium orientis]MBK5948263.1 dipeptide epimerase [Rhodobium orientis]RAI24924.1 dipeptide epimerase [Rhodobium orientis]